MKKVNQDVKSVQADAAANLATAIIPQTLDSTPVETSTATEKSNPAKDTSENGSKLLPSSPVAAAVSALAPPAPINIGSLRLDKLGYGETTPVEKLLTTVPVKKPNKFTFFRVREGEEWEFSAYVIELKHLNETYIVSSEIARVLPGLFKSVVMYLAVDEEGNAVIIPVPLPDESGRRNNWHESLLQAVILARSKWIRIESNLKTGSNDPYVAPLVNKEPNWPKHSMEEILEIAFRGKIITDVNHPLVQGLLGNI